MNKKTIIKIIILAIILGGLFWFWSVFQDHPLFIFLSILRAPEEPIEEVIIRGYGEVPLFLLKEMKNVVENKIGVKATIDPLLPGFKGQSLYYDSGRDQYNADMIWNTEGKFANSVSNKRLVMVVDVDLYTDIQQERPYVLTRSTPNVSVILISAYRLQRLSDEELNEPASNELASARIQKLTLRTLGVSVFLEGFSSFGKERDISCVMYRGRILSKLDMQGDDFCEKNKRKLENYFVINAVK